MRVANYVLLFIGALFPWVEALGQNGGEKPPCPHAVDDF